MVLISSAFQKVWDWHTYTEDSNSSLTHCGLALNFRKFGDGAQTFKVTPNLVKENSHAAFKFHAQFPSFITSLLPNHLQLYTNICNLLSSIETLALSQTKFKKLKLNNLKTLAVTVFVVSPLFLLLQ